MNVPQIMHRAFDHFNKRLFNGRLPHMKLAIADLKGDAVAHAGMPSFLGLSFLGTPITFDRSYFGGGVPCDMATLVHEMVHGSVHDYGESHGPKTRAEMLRVGLVCCEYGWHTVVMGGPFDRACIEFLGFSPSAADYRTPHLSEIVQGAANMGHAMPVSSVRTASGVQSFTHSAAPDQTGRSICIVVDLSESMYERLPTLGCHVQQAMDRSRKCTIIGFRKRAEILMGVDDLARICTGTGTCANPGPNSGNDVAAGLRLAASVNPDAVVLITDAAEDIFDKPWGQVLQAAGRLKRVETVWLPQPSLVMHAEQATYSIPTCGGGTLNPAEYLQKAEKLMRQLARGGGEFQTGAQNSYQNNAEYASNAIGAAIDAALGKGASTPTHAGGNDHEVAIFKKGDSLAMSGDLARGADDMFRTAIRVIAEKHQQAVARYGKNSERYQSEMQAVIKPALDGLSARAELADTKADLQLLTSAYDHIVQKVRDIGAIGDQIDDMSSRQLSGRQKRFDQTHERSEQLFASGGRALHSAFSDDVPQIREIKGEWRDRDRYVQQHRQPSREISASPAPRQRISGTCGAPQIARQWGTVPRLTHREG
jgi:hypothetical protein